VPLLAVCRALVEHEAQACPGPLWWLWPYTEETHQFEVDDAPVDVRPWWIERECGDPSEEFGSCSLVAPGHAVAVSLECDETPLLHFVPEEPLLPGRTYALECATGWVEPSRVTTRADTAPSSPPEEVVVTSAVHVQQDETCCGWEYVRLELADEEPAFLREGGRIEVRGDGGTTELVIRAPARDVDIGVEPGFERLELTPFAANGARGPTTTLTWDAVRRQPVYLPCAVTSGSPSLALWLLAPLLWIRAHGRRRRRSA
jgi:hypothetical protein